ncbi:MAG: ECF transporter S component [Clostridiales bacterium]|jgi:uncharacterized membrane protein|nr:ECF transporter S component [Clostridiales bacterium]
MIGSLKNMGGAATKKIAYTGIFTALTAVLTLFSIPVPGGGYIHLGDGMIFLACAVLPVPYAVFAAGVGSMIADLSLGYTQYFIPTLLIKAAMALIVCLLGKNADKDRKRVWVFLTASLFMQFAYFVYELFLNDFAVAGGVLHVFMGLLQTVFSVPLGVFLVRYAKKNGLIGSE